MPSPSLDTRLARLYDWHPLRFDSGLDPKLLLFCAQACELYLIRLDELGILMAGPSPEWHRRANDYLRRVAAGEATQESAVLEWLEAANEARAAIARSEARPYCERDRLSELTLAALGARRDPNYPRPGRRNGIARRLVGLVVAQYRKPNPAAINARLSELFDDLFGDFETVPTAFQAEWRTPDVLGLASSVRQSRDFGLMPVLADALEEAGCDAADLLAHCRAGGPHFAGCWALDRVQYDWDEQYDAPAPPSAG